jgi:2-polyprenyl-3-methyl-5-hydroxy-6-metoxy-1,4-benzoquinol methylase
VSRADVARRLASLYDRRDLRTYVRWKLAADRVYSAVLEQLPDEPLIDVGCGIGLLPCFLREHGFRAPITGSDFDARKIEIARKAAACYREIEFIVSDARGELPPYPNVVMVDVLQYLDSASQKQLLASVARNARFVAIRQGIRDQSWRYRVTVIADVISRGVRWIKADSLNFPTHERVVEAFDGFECSVTPLWGRTPYNNYLFVFRRTPSSGTTNE